MKLKRLLSSVVTAALLIGVAAFAPTPVKAAASPCDGTHEGWIALTQADFDAISEGSSISLTKNENYYLSENITVTNKYISIPASSTNSICLNGYKLEATALDSSSYRALIYAWQTSGAGITVNICDCSEAGSGKLTVNKTAAQRGLVIGASGVSASAPTVINFYGGSICDSYSSKTANGGVVRLGAYGTLNMYEGSSIKNIKYGGASNCRGIRLSAATSKFNMYGGTISNTTTETNASTVTFSTAAAVNIYGGTIDGTNSVCAINGFSNAANVTLYGGTIINEIKGDSTTVNYPVTVNGMPCSQGASATPGTYSDANVAYDVATSTLTVSNPAAITSLTWGEGFAQPDAPGLTIKLGDDWKTDLTSAIAAGEELTIDLNGHTLTEIGGITNAGTLTVTDSSANHDGQMICVVTNTGTLSDSYSLIKAPEGGHISIDTGSCGAGMTWTMYDDGALALDGSGSMTAYADAPWSAYAGQITSVSIASGITSISANVFAGCTELAHVYYDGVQDAWAAIEIGANNDPLLDAKLHTVVLPLSVTAGTVNVAAGATATVPIQFADNSGIASAILTVTYDPALTLTAVDNGTVLEGLEFVGPGDLTANPIRLVWGGASASAGNGTVATLTFTAPATAGTYPITVSCADGDVVDDDIASVEVLFTAGSVTVESGAPAHTPGDMDGNGTVNMKDSVLLMRYVAGGYGVELSLDVADIDHSGTVNMKDTVLLMRYIAGGYGVVLS